MKTLVVGADPFPPYQYYDENGDIKGSDYDMVKAVIDKMGYEARYIIDEWSVIEKAFSEKKIDLVFQVQKTPERERKYHFSGKLRDATTSIVTWKDKTDQGSMDELFADGSKLGVIEGYLYGDIIDSIATGSKVNFKSLEDLLQSVNSGETEYGVVDLGVFNYINRNKIYDKVKLLDKLNFNRPLYVCLNDPALRDAFDKYLGKD